MFVSIWTKIHDLEEERSVLQAKIERLEKQLMEHGEALTILAQLRQLYRLSPDMKKPQVESAAKYMMKKAEEGLRVARQRRQEEYIKNLQTKIKRLEKEIGDLRAAAVRKGLMKGGSFTGKG